jgi:hypothetical protein
MGDGFPCIIQHCTDARRRSLAAHFFFPPFFAFFRFSTFASVPYT